MCVEFCPELAMFMHDDYRAIQMCILRSMCKVCPTGAIYISEE